MTSEIKQLHKEVRLLRRDLEEIKEMLVPEVNATREEVRAVERGRKEFSRGEFFDWKEIKKKNKKRAPFPDCIAWFLRRKRSRD